MADAPCIQLSSVSKHFGGVKALDQVSFEIHRGEVHAVVGENGAGKSTLMKLLAGVHQPDAGEIRVEGQPVRLRNPRDSRSQGIGIVFQELNLFPHRTVTANVFAHRELSARWGWLRHRSMREATRRVLAELGADLSPDAIVGSLTIGEQQLVEIARTLEQQPRIIILDEPNSALGEAESRRLFSTIHRLRQQGITIVYVSHRLEEVFAIADRITVLRDGQYVKTHATNQSTMPEIIAAMIGRPLEAVFPRDLPRSPPGRHVVQVREVCSPPRLGPVSFNACAGEIVGFAGLEGAGIDELFQVLFGLRPVVNGEILLLGESWRATSPLAAIRRGCALIPASRREQGLMMDWSIARNATLVVIGRFLNRLGLIDTQSVRRTTEKFMQRLAIVAESSAKRVSALSGGNQQKVLLAKWLAADPVLLILNDPTRGVDVGAKREIYQLCRQLKDEGMSILITSSDVEEILGLADRVFVLSKGRIVREFQRDEAPKATLMHAMAGQGTL